MRTITLTTSLLLLLAPGCTSSVAKNARHEGIISALESRDHIAVDIALWTLRQNGFDVPEIALEGPYAEAKPELKKLADKLGQLPPAQLRELDESHRYHQTIYSPRLRSGGKGWKDCPTSEATTTHDRSPHAKALALVMRTQADVIKAVDTENWWHDTKTREWTAQRPFAPGTLDSSHMFQVEYKIDGLVVARWLVDTERRSVQRRTVSNAGAQAPYVQCVGRFTDYEAEYPWSEDWVDQGGTLTHDDGKCPRAAFCLSAPAIYAGRTVRVLYRYERKDRSTPPSLSQKGKSFSFELPEDFFAGRSTTLDSTEVRNLRVIP
jgi:hypothetical protein